MDWLFTQFILIAWASLSAYYGGASNTRCPVSSGFRISHMEGTILHSPSEPAHPSFCSYTRPRGHWTKPTHDVSCQELCREQLWDGFDWLLWCVSFPDLALISLRVHVLGSKPIPALERLPKLRLRYLPDSPTAFRRLPFILAGPLKVLHQIFAILIVLVFLIRVPPEFILVQVRPTCQGHHKLLKKGLTESSKRTDFTHRPVCCKDPRV